MVTGRQFRPAATSAPAPSGSDSDKFTEIKTTNQLISTSQSIDTALKLRISIRWPSGLLNESMATGATKTFR